MTRPVGIRPPKNKAESQFFEFAQKNNWTIRKQGWPDFACFRNGDFMVVEVKKDGQDLKRMQRRVMTELSYLGVKCYVWIEPRGLIPFVPPLPLRLSHPEPEEEKNKNIEENRKE